MLVSLMKMGTKVQRLLEVKDKVVNTVKAGFTGRTLPKTGAVQSAHLSNGKES